MTLEIFVFAHANLEESALPDDFWSHWIAWHVERRYGQRSTLPPEWHSRLSAADRSGDHSIRGRGHRVDPREWTAPEALAAAYAAWYPLQPVGHYMPVHERSERAATSEPGGGSGGEAFTGSSERTQ